MHPLTRALFSTWDLRPEILVVLIPLGILYTLGWRKLRQHSANRRLATWPRLIAYLSGLWIIAFALMSPIDALGGQLFFMHMIQHKLSIMFAAPLLWLANPFPIVLWSLPWTVRHRIGGLFTRNSVVRRVLTTITQPGVTWLVFITVYLGWHDSSAYNAALYYDWVHDLQHITFLLAALLYWYPIIGAAPHLNRRLPSWGKMIYLIGTVPPNMALGISIAFASEVVYTYYSSVPRFWGFTVMQDQQISGAIMWIPGSMMFLMVALFILGRLFYYNGEKTSSRRDWDTAAMIAPGRQNQYHKVMAHRTAVQTTQVNGSHTP
jgi:putative membrane protein